MLSKNMNGPHYTSRIEEFIHGYMIIAMPMEKGYPVFLERDNVFYGKIFDETGVYSFKSTFVDKKMNPLPIWIVTTPTDIKKNQQRSYVRFDVSLPIVIDYFLDDDQTEAASLKLTTKDLSGGGLRLISNKQISVGKKIQLKLEFPECEVFQVNGEVVRINQPQVERQLFWISIKFLGIHESIRDKISKFIFKKQLEQRQKGI
jgi:c-di-GMP-binding flagellar brake protein YcgR